MKPASPFEYFAPTRVEETCAFLARYSDEAKISVYALLKENPDPEER